MQNKNLLQEPFTNKLFETDIYIVVKEIPQDLSGDFELPVTIRANKNIINKKINATLLKSKNILVLQGELNNLKIGHLTDSVFFKKRENWKYSLHFDLRLQLDKR